MAKKKVAKKKKISPKKKTAKRAAPAVHLSQDPWANPSLKLTAAQRKALKEQDEVQKATEAKKEALKKLSFDELSEYLVTGAQDFQFILDELKTRNEKPIKMKLGQRWYPVTLTESYIHRGWTGFMCNMTISMDMFDVKWTRNPSVWDSDFVDRFGAPCFKKFSAILQESGLGLSTLEDLKENKELVGEASKFRNRNGVAIDLVSSVLYKNDFFFGPKLIDMPFGSVKHPRVGIIESELELADHNYDDYEDSGSEPGMPFLRVFSLELKKYIFVDVRDVKEHSFQENAIDKLVLPDELKQVITSVFNAKDVFGDLFAGRHGGMIIMANGGPGIGKTLSAEAFAEQTKRPLYVLEMGELGVKLDQVEQALQLIFTRAARWNTVLLFDEVDIFLSKRTEHDLERNAIVGVFLRLLDQYRGLLFLTTNRAEVIDPAFASRITLRLDYPELTNEIRGKIWEHMLKAADLQVLGNMDSIISQKLNGRQVRNVVRLLKATTDIDTIHVDSIQKYIKFSPVIDKR